MPSRQQFKLAEFFVSISGPQGAHHIDLMFSREDDGEGVRSARLQQERLIAAWIAAARVAGMCGAPCICVHAV